MPKAVLTTKVDPSYDDLPEERYHFPRTYLNAARAALGEWIVYYEPRRSSAHLSSSGGRQSYFATARIVRVDGDPRRADHYYAYVEDYLEFDRPVPFREDGFFYESGLQKEDGSVNKGRFGRAVRLLDDAEYSLILAAGFETGTAERERFGIREGVHPDPGRLELVDRPIIERLSRRPFRDRVFSTGIKRAYDNTCAISGLRIINGGGRAEAQAAHTRSTTTTACCSRGTRSPATRCRWRTATGCCECRTRRSTGRIGGFWSIIGSMCSRGDGGGG